jgi:hypothetical protein
LWSFVTKAATPVIQGEPDLDLEKRKLTYQIVFQTCEDDNKSLIMITREPFKAWKVLGKVYAPSNLTECLHTSQELFYAKYPPDEYMTEYMARVRKLHAASLKAGNATHRL